MNKRIAATMVATMIGVGGVAVMANSVSAESTPRVVVNHDRGDREAERTALAELLGLTVDELHAQMEAGKSLAQVAEAQGVSVTKVVDLLVGQARTRITEMVNSVPPARSEMRGGRRHGGFGRGNKQPAEGVESSGA